MQTEKSYLSLLAPYREEDLCLRAMLGLIHKGSCPRAMWEPSMPQSLSVIWNVVRDMLCAPGTLVPGSFKPELGFLRKGTCLPPGQAFTLGLLT